MASSTPIHNAVPFLTDAAHLLRTVAPETSAHLMRHCTDLLQNNGIPVPDTHYQHSCATCGHIMIPGYDASSIQLQRADRQAKRSRATTAPTAARSERTAPVAKALKKRIACGRCKRTNSFKLGDAPNAARRRRQKPSLAVEPAPPVVSEKASNIKNSSNASSKKRAKNRKAGLQSLLAAGQNQKSKSLSLSDFMK